MPAPVTELGSYTLLEANVGLAGAVTLLNPLAAQFDAMLFGAFGLGSLKADIALQFDVAASLQVDLGLQISDPLAGLNAALSAVGQLQAGLQAAISLGIPTVSAELSASASANAALSAALGARLGGLTALIEASLAIKVPAVNLLAELGAQLSAGPVVVMSFGFNAGAYDPIALATVGGQINSLLSGGLTGIAPGDDVAGIIILTKAPTAAAGISALLRVG